MEIWFWPTLEHCGQLQKFCETMPDQYNIASGHIYNMQFDLHQNPDWFVRCEQHKVAEIGDFDPTIGLGGGFEWSCTHNSPFELSKVTLMNFSRSF